MLTFVLSFKIYIWLHQAACVGCISQLEQDLLGPKFLFLPSCLHHIYTFFFFVRLGNCEWHQTISCVSLRGLSFSQCVLLTHMYVLSGVKNMHFSSPFVLIQAPQPSPPTNMPSSTLCTETSWLLTWLQRQGTLMVRKASHPPITSHTTLHS